MERGIHAAPPTAWWAWACIVVLVSGVCTLGVDVLRLPSGPALALGYGLGTLYPALLLAGALCYSGRTVPLGLPVLAGLVGLVRGAAEVGGHAALAHGAAGGRGPGGRQRGVDAGGRSHAPHAGGPVVDVGARAARDPVLGLVRA
jgi:hypothetical protein